MVYRHDSLHARLFRSLAVHPIVDILADDMAHFGGIFHRLHGLLAIQVNKLEPGTDVPNRFRGQGGRECSFQRFPALDYHQTGTAQDTEELGDAM